MLEQTENSPCSKQCYLRLTCLEDMTKLRQSTKLLYSPIQLAFVSLGVSIFQFDPCLIWDYAQEKFGKTSFTCDMVFLYLIYDYSLVKKFALKLQPSEEMALKMIKKSTKPPCAPPPRHKKIEASNVNNCLELCHHHFLNSEPTDEHCRDCPCAKKGYCLRECYCSDECDLKRGCECKSSRECGKNNCPCFDKSRECIPGLCINCFEHGDRAKVNKCKNNAIILHKQCILRIGESTIAGAGLGLFTTQDIKAKDMVYTYTGEMITEDVEQVREAINQTNDFYNFGTHGHHGSVSIDSRYLGNKARFINHGNKGQRNLESKIKVCEGKEVIAFYATKDIPKGAELFFNYDAEGNLVKHHRDKYPFITN